MFINPERLEITAAKYFSFSLPVLALIIYGLLML